MTDLLDRLQTWYATRCDGDWEHHHGVFIDNLDNPGWRVRINLLGTPLENTDFTEISSGDPEGSDWIVCKKDNTDFTGFGDAAKLEVILAAFLDWAGSNGPGGT